MTKSRQIIVILGGWIAKDAEGQWHTADFYDGYNQFGTNGHRVRVLAGYYLWRQNPEAVIVASGSKGKLSDVPDAPTAASVIKQELRELGVPDSQIIEEDKSGKTADQLRKVVDLVKGKSFAKVLLVSNTYHLPRIRAFLIELPELREAYDNIDYSVVSADEIVTQHDERMKEIISQVYRSPEMQKHIVAEQQGIADLKAGKYNFSN